MIRQKHLTEKILKYETFLNERLRLDLKAVLQERDEIFTETAEFVALRVQSFGILFFNPTTPCVSSRQDTWLAKLDPWPQFDSSQYWVPDEQVEQMCTGPLPTSSTPLFLLY